MEDEYKSVFVRLTNYRVKRQLEEHTLSVSDLLALDDKIERLERRLEELALKESGSDEGPRVSAQVRSDRLSAEIEAAMRELGDKATPASIMRELKSYAGKLGSCIKQSTADGVIWQPSGGEEQKLDMKALNKRLARRAKKDAKPAKAPPRPR